MHSLPRGLRFLVFISLFVSITSSVYSQNQAGILSSNIQFSGIVNNNRVVWETKSAKVFIDKVSGEFVIRLESMDLEAIEGKRINIIEPAEKNSISLSGTLPVADIIERTNERHSFTGRVKVGYNSLEEESVFSFTVLTFANKGFSVSGQGIVNHEELSISKLAEFDKELHISINIIGQ